MLYTVEELRASNVRAPDLQDSIFKRPFTISSPDPVEFRQLRADHLARLRHLMPLGGKPVPEVDERDHSVTARDSSSIKVRVYTPNAEERRVGDGGPLIVMFHEGGFMYGDLTDEEMNCRLFSREFGAVCVNVEYRLAPEFSFPTYVDDSIDALKWAAVNASSLGANPSQRGLIVGGSSAGGNIAAVLSQLSRTENFDPPITGQYLSVPFLFNNHAVPEKYKERLLSPFENKFDPVLQSSSEERSRRHAEILRADTSSALYTPLASPSYPPTANHPSRPLAPAYIQCAGLDPLRDQALIYAQIMENEYAAKTKVDLYPGYGHMFWTNWPELEASHVYVRDTVIGMRWLLEEAGLHVKRS